MTSSHRFTNVPSSSRLAGSVADKMGSIRVADIVIACYVVLGIVFEDGSIIVQVSRVMLVTIAAFELAVKPFRANLVQLWQVLFVAFAASSVSWAHDESSAQQMALTLAINGACITAFVYLAQGDPLRVRVFVVSAMVAPLLLMTRLAMEGGLLVFLETRSADGTSANFVGMTAAFGFAFAYLCHKHRLSLGRWIASILMAGNLGVVLLSASRKALLIVVLVMLLFSWFDRTKGGSPRAAKVLSAAIVGIAGYWSIMNVQSLYVLVGWRIEAMINGFFGGGTVDDSTTTRMRLIENGSEWFGEQPWIGYGADNFRALMASYEPRMSPQYAHNNFIELAVNFGMVGVVLFYWFYVMVIVLGLRRGNSLSATGAMFLSVLIGLLSVEYGMVDYFSRIFMLYVAMAWVVLQSDTLGWGKPVPRESALAPTVGMAHS